jgi:hypothetical protein
LAPIIRNADGIIYLFSFSFRILPSILFSTQQY